MNNEKGIGILQGRIGWTAFGERLGLTGNNDMHLKNFSLLERESGNHELSPAYDLLNVAIANPSDTEELALTLNGKKSRITRNDFLEAARKSDVSEVVIKRLVSNFERCLPAWKQKIDESFLSDEMKDHYLKLLNDRMDRL